MNLDRKRTEKIASVTAIVIASVQIILSILQIFNILEHAILYSGFLSCIVLLLLSYTFWPRQRKTAVFLIVISAVTFLMYVAAVILFLLGL